MLHRFANPTRTATDRDGTHSAEPARYHCLHPFDRDLPEPESAEALA